VSEDVQLKANKRDEFGRKVKALRREGRTPAVIHDHGKDSIHITITEMELQKAYSVAGKHSPVSLDVDGKKYTTLIKEVTRAPARADILHGVFQAVSADEKVTTEIPVHLVGDAPAERASLLVLRSHDTIEVEAKPGDLVEAIEISAETLAEVGDKINVSDLKMPPGITLKTDPDLVIASVEMPKDQIAEADAAAAELADDATQAEGGDEEPGETEEQPEDKAEESAKSEEE